MNSSVPAADVSSRLQPSETTTLSSMPWKIGNIYAITAVAVVGGGLFGP
jgi:hypothetical protein